MNQKKSLTELQKQLKMLSNEDKKIETFSENYKKKISEEIKQFNPKVIKNMPTPGNSRDEAESNFKIPIKIVRYKSSGKLKIIF